MSTERWSSPRPETIKLSPHSKSIFRPTFVSSSFSSLSRICLEVTIFPSRPANGELFTRNSIFSVGSSIVIAGIASTFSEPPIVSPTNISAIPAIVTISHARASFTFTFSSPSLVSISVIFPFRFSQLFDTIHTSCPCFTVPSKIRPIPRRPRKLSYPRFAICILNALSESFFASGTCSII